VRVVVTRPEPEAGRWVAELQARGIDAQALPLIDIAPAPAADALLEAWGHIDSFRAAMFVSGNAVKGFFAPMHVPWPPRTRAWATGPGTRDALQAAGVPPAAIDAPGDDAPQFDSEALWRQVRGQVRAGDAVLIVRGGNAVGEPSGRDWLRDELEAQGARVETVVAYVRRPPAWHAGEQARAAAAAADGSVWLLSSSEAVENLVHLLPAQDWRRARALVTHPRIAQTARAAGFAVVHESRPTLEAVVAALESVG
jgi:uroporphyrinogen-III synthase